MQVYIFLRNLVYAKNQIIETLVLRCSFETLYAQGCRFVSVVGGMIGAKIFSAMDQGNQSCRSVWQVAPLPSQDLILGGGSEHAKRGS